jgi:hypothetical protein
MIENDKVSNLRAQLDKHRMARAKQLITIWRLRSLTPVFKSWALYTKSARGRKKQLMGKVVLRMQNAQLWAGFRQWVQFTQKKKENQVAQSLAGAAHAQKKRRIQALMARWQKGSISSVFRAWATWSRENRARKKILLGKVVRRMGSAKLWAGFRTWKKFCQSAERDELKEKMRGELMATMALSGGRGMAGGGSGDYQTLLIKYRNLKHKKLTLEAGYDSLFKFLGRFRVQIARSIEEEISRLTHHCKCDVCQTKRRMLSQTGINEWLFQVSWKMREA